MSDDDCSYWDPEDGRDEGPVQWWENAPDELIEGREEWADDDGEEG